MHLANMALVDGRILIFDCLEFNENLRWIDTISEVAFLVMDLAERGRPELAHRALNGYLEITGDYRGLAVLRFYQLYRAMVRAKVAAIRLHQSDVESAEGRSQLEQFRGYLALAQTYTQPQRPLLVLTHGLSGSGKSTWTQALLECWGAIRLRSDSERKRLFELAPTASSGSGLDSGLYSRDASALTYRRLADLAADVLAAGHPVIVDATFLEAGQRRAFRELAERLGLPWVILDFTAPEPVLRRRIVERMHTGRDASEASLAVLDHQLAMRDPLDDNERAHCVLVDTERPVAADGLLGALSQMTERLRR
jgi:predicted kinase